MRRVVMPINSGVLICKANRGVTSWQTEKKLKRYPIILLNVSSFKNEYDAVAIIVLYNDRSTLFIIDPVKRLFFDLN